MRVDWLTPDGLPAWGDGRLVIAGTEGMIEMRKYIDIGGEKGTDHLFLVDNNSVQRIDCISALWTTARARRAASDRVGDASGTLLQGNGNSSNSTGDG